MLNRFMLIAVFVPLAIILVALAVANREAVTFTMDPFNPGNPALSVQTPLFVLLFAALAIGLIVGGLATWFRQGHYRRLARQRAQEADALRQAAIRAPQPASDLPALQRPAA